MPCGMISESRHHDLAVRLNDDRARLVDVSQEIGSHETADPERHIETAVAVITRHAKIDIAG